MDAVIIFPKLFLVYHRFLLTSSGGMGSRKRGLGEEMTCERVRGSVAGETGGFRGVGAHRPTGLGTGNLHSNDTPQLGAQWLDC